MILTKKGYYICFFGFLHYNQTFKIARLSVGSGIRRIFSGNTVNVDGIRLERLRNAISGSVN